MARCRLHGVLQSRHLVSCLESPALHLEMADNLLPHQVTVDAFIFKGRTAQQGYNCPAVVP
jgi:hypothetical protein